MITVLIPTANRPDFLRTALRSVQRQTAVTTISRVIVSEHLGNRASEQVCKEFEDLPIRYICRDPEEAKRGFALMLKEVDTEFIAILFDDDWWAPSHIANGARYCLEERGLGCYFSAYFMVEGERSTLRTHPTTEFWFGAAFPSLQTDWKLNLADAVSACLVDPPCTYSSMIAPLEKIEKAYLAQLKVGNPYDSDRIMTLELGKQGLLVVNPIPEVFVRFHPGQDKNRFSEDDVRRFKSMSIMHLLNICREHKIDPGREFDARIVHAEKRIASQICQRIVHDCEDFIKDGRIDSLVLRNHWTQVGEARNQRRMRKIAKQLLAITRRGWRAMIPR
jgi:hypothetical protein